MIRLKMSKQFYSYERVIFPDSLVKSEADIIRYMRFYDRDKLPVGGVADVYVTPITDLTESQKDIQKHYSKDVRYEIRRAERENISYRIYDRLNTHTDAVFIREIAQKYFNFCDSIGQSALKSNLKQNEFLKLIIQGNLVVSKAEFENGWIYHIYQTDGMNAMLWFSFSDYREKGVNKSLAGWANRGLHDHDIMYFREQGYRCYDWGNIASRDEPNNIDKFKMSFGGELKEVYCCFVGNTTKGKFLLWLNSLRHRT